jgi:sensor domain CHASE-containing protein
VSKSPSLVSVRPLTSSREHGRASTGRCEGCYMIKRLVHESRDSGRFYCSEHCRVKQEVRR